MALKSFKELYKLDLSKYIKKKPTFYKDDKGKLQKTDESKWLNYIEWATVLVLLYENGAEAVSYNFGLNKEDYPAIFNNGKNPFISVYLNIDNKTYFYQYPVIDGNRVDDTPNQMTIHKAQQRGLVKCIAVNTGLGLSLWQDEENTFNTIGSVELLGISKEEELNATVKMISFQLTQCQDEEMVKKIRKELIEAEANGTNTLEFYNEILGRFMS